MGEETVIVSTDLSCRETCCSKSSWGVDGTDARCPAAGSDELRMGMDMAWGGSGTVVSCKREERIKEGQEGRRPGRQRAMIANRSNLPCLYAVDVRSRSAKSLGTPVV